MDIFTYEYYREIIKQMKKANEIYNFKTIDTSVKTGYILRHDIDIDIDKAYTMSNLEKEMDITSTYFILVTSDLYNVLSFKNKRIIKSMYTSGFEIGLHFDPVIYGDINSRQMQKEAEKECSILEDIIGDKVETISLHNPSIHNKYPIFEGYKNAYSKKFFNSDLYLSDSCKDFRGKEIFDFIKKGRSELLQIVLHPIHFSDKKETYVQSFNKIIETNINNFDHYIRDNKTYKKEIEEDKLINCFANYIKENRDNE